MQPLTLKKLPESVQPEQQLSDPLQQVHSETSILPYSQRINMQGSDNRIHSHRAALSNRSDALLTRQLARTNDACFDRRVLDAPADVPCVKDAMWIADACVSLQHSS